MNTTTSSTTTKYINIDTRIDDNECYLLSDYKVRLPEKIKHVKSLSIASIEIPITFFNISCYMKNNYFEILGSNSSTTILLPDDNYTIQSIVTTIQMVFNSNTNTKGLRILLSPTNTVKILSDGYDYRIDFLTNDIGRGISRGCVKSKLGWLLGFRLPSYNIEANSGIIAETIGDLTSPRYLYLSLEHQHQHNENNHEKHDIFDSNLFCIDKNIIARITLENKGFSYGSILPANIVNGLLISGTRNYHNPIDIKKLRVKLMNEFGYIMNLNGFEISFVMVVEQKQI